MMDLKVQFSRGDDKFYFPGQTESKELEKNPDFFPPPACFISTSLIGVAM